jgi:SAM-dependent methyltransferase
MKRDRTKWEARYRAGDRPHDGPPSGLLRRWLPVAAAPRALDIATGLGRNALALARAGYEVDAVDISPTALEEAARRARREGLRTIRWIAADLDRWRPPRGRYDVVVNAFFLDRRLWPALRAAVRPGGLLFFETHLASAHSDGGPPGRRRRLRPGELRRIFGDWEILYARDGMCREGARTLPLGRIVVRRPFATAVRPAGIVNRRPQDGARGGRRHPVTIRARRPRTAGRSGWSRGSSR